MNKSAFTHLALSGILAGGLSLTACAGHNSNSGGMNSGSSSTGASMANGSLMAAKTFDAFKDACAQSGGMFAQHDCKGQNGCKGHAFQDGMGVSQNECKGHSSCKGASCVGG